MPHEDPHPIDIGIGQNLHLFRTQAGLSQTALADGLGLTFERIQKHEKGTNRLAASWLYDCAQILKISPNAILLLAWRGARSASGLQDRSSFGRVDRSLSTARSPCAGAGYPDGAASRIASAPIFRLNSMRYFSCARPRGLISTFAYSGLPRRE